MKKVLGLLKGSYSFVRLVQDMNRTDEVFEVVSELNDPARMQPVADHFRQSERGAAALREWPRVGRVSLAELKQLPEGTLGRTYAEHMLKLNLDPQFFPEMKVENELDFVRMHLYETHDLWHVVTGFATDVAGELGLQAFYAAQFPAGPLPPVLLAAGMLNTVFRKQNDNAQRFDAVARGWFLGKSASPLFGLHWAELWEKPLDELRRELGCHDDRTPKNRTA